MNHSSLVSANASRRGFTLVELMISIAISLLLVAGINAIFRTTAATIGSGQSTLQATRDLRNAFDTLNSDIGGMLDSGSLPYLLIYNQNQPAFRDAIDEKTDTDYKTILPEGPANTQVIFGSRDGVTSSSSPLNAYGGLPLIADNRNHRVDILSFFSSGRFRRQTGLESNPVGSNIANYQSTHQSDSAYIWYGHARLPQAVVPPLTSDIWLSQVGQYRPPGLTSLGGTPQTAASNPNGFYAKDWSLARRAILLSTPTPAPNGVPNVAAGSPIIPRTGPNGYIAQGYLNADPNANPVAGSPLPTLRPFEYGTPATYDGNINSNLPYPIQDSGCDLAGISLDAFLDRVKTATAFPPPLPAAQVPTRNPDWYLPLLTNGKQSVESTFRYAAKPWATRNTAAGAPFSPTQRRDDMALNSPIFMKGCSQFIVEFAGDYTTQIPAGNTPDAGKIIGQSSDHVLDFDIIFLPDGTKQSRIRWYGLPRHYGVDQFSTESDVRPIFDFMQDSSKCNIPLPTVIALPFEKIGYKAAPPSAFPQNRPNEVRSYTCAFSALDLQFPAKDDDPKYFSIDPLDPSNPQYAATTKVNAGPGRTAEPIGNAYPQGFMPWMIRVTMRVDDPNGRLPEGLTMQYIFNLRHK